jgi:hypothetical protein
MLDAFVLRYLYIYIEVSQHNPREGRLRRGGRSDGLGRRRLGNPNNLDAPPGWNP